MKDVTMELEGEVIFKKVYLACNFIQRFMGLMGKKDLGASEAMLLETGSVHTFFMHFTIDAVYIDENFRILYLEKLEPWKIGSIKRGVKYVLEYKADGGRRFDGMTGKRIELKITEGRS